MNKSLENIRETETEAISMGQHANGLQNTSLYKFYISLYNTSTEIIEIRELKKWRNGFTNNKLSLSVILEVKALIIWESQHLFVYSVVLMSLHIQI